VKLIALALVLSLISGCAISSRVAAGYGAMADSGSCGGALTALAVGIDGAAATALLLVGDSVSTFDQVAVGALALDVLVGGIEAISDCTHD
jgi:hypothetical protein